MAENCGIQNVEVSRQNQKRTVQTKPVTNGNQVKSQGRGRRRKWNPNKRTMKLGKRLCPGLHIRYSLQYQAMPPWYHRSSNLFQRNPSAARPRTQAGPAKAVHTQSSIGAASVQPPAAGQTRQGNNSDRRGGGCVRYGFPVCQSHDDRPTRRSVLGGSKGTSLDPCSLVCKNNSIESPNSHRIDVAITADSLFGS